MLALIRAHAVLHQLSRDRDAHGRIVADLGDYIAVRDLVGDVVSAAAGQTVPDTVRETVDAVVRLAGSEGVTAVAVAEVLKVDKSAASRRLAVARAGGYVKNLEEHRGRPGRWAVGDPLPGAEGLLPVAHTLGNPLPPETTGVEGGGCTVARLSEGVENAPDGATPASAGYGASGDDEPPWLDDVVGYLDGAE
ncbi:MAG: helix-turn-helix domain-containing protein [Actinomycetota bacterium]